MSSLPPAWVDALFSRLATRYGRPFYAMWDGLEIDAVKADWAEVLGGFHDKPEAIAYALENLPIDKAPNALQFRDFCRRSPDNTPKLPAPKADRKVADAAVKALGGVHVGSTDPKAWAYAMREREINHGGFLKAEAGAPEKAMTPFQRRAWREALDVKPAAGDDA